MDHHIRLIGRRYVAYTNLRILAILDTPSGHRGMFLNPVKTGRSNVFSLNFKHPVLVANSSLTVTLRSLDEHKDESVALSAFFTERTLNTDGNGMETITVDWYSHFWLQSIRA